VSSEYRQVFEKDHALSRRFQKVDVNEPSIDETIDILRGLKKQYEKFHNVSYTDQALQSAVHLAVKHIHERFLPEKAIDVIDEAGAFVRLQKQAENQVESSVDSNQSIDAVANDKLSNQPVVDEDALVDDLDVSQAADGVVEPEAMLSEADNKVIDAAQQGGQVVIDVPQIEYIISKIARIPPKSVSTDDKSVLQNLESNLKHLVFGQDEAIKNLADAIKLSRAGLKPDDKPIGSFMFAGPTGVGKTEVSRQLANLLGIELVRFDMSEYMEAHTASRLIGAPPGYVGFDQGGLLTEKINQFPHCVLLLDEIEKAHPDIFNILLQVMDHGTLTDNNGRKTDFRNVIIIMTTNAGAEAMQKSTIGFTNARESGDEMADIKKFFTPEFRNRLDAIVSFKALDETIIMRVVDKFLMQLEEQLHEKKVDATFSTALRAHLAKHGFDPLMGARPMQRIIQDTVRKALADELLFGRLAQGGHVDVDIDADGKVLLNFDTPKLPGKAAKVDVVPAEEI